METTGSGNQTMDFIIKHKYKIIIGVIILLILTIILIVAINNHREAKQEDAYSETYSNAIGYLREGNPEKAKELFATLPDDYANSEYGLTAGQWPAEIDAKYNTDYLGFWGNNYYSIEITQRISFLGIAIEYRKDVKDGLLVYEGKLHITEPNQTNVKLGSSKGSIYYESNAHNYRLVLVDENTMEVYFQGELQRTLSKKK